MVSGSSSQQYGALPWRAVHRPEVLLITSRETRRWVLPKGWPMPGLRGHQCASREAFEEAGVRGDISDKPCGSYHYTKVLPGGIRRLCQVDVYDMHVNAMLITWPESTERNRRWFTPDEAASLVNESELAKLITAFFAARF
jgi:8-oxo-dGTP pyrophosphatase MutT (NUDIX family)